MIYKQPPSWLAHHGIEGQKWGIQHGPPYPLGSDVSTGNKLKISSNKEFTKDDDTRIKRVTKVHGKFAGHREKRKILKEKDTVAKNQQYLYDNYTDDVIDYLNKADAFNTNYRHLFDEYDSDRDMYSEIAGNVSFDMWFHGQPDILTSKVDRAQHIWGHVYDDLDQGTYSSENLFLLDKNRKNYDKFMNKYLQDKEALDKSYEKLYEILMSNTKEPRASSVFTSSNTLEKILSDNDLPNDLNYVMYDAMKYDDPKVQKELLSSIDKYKNQYLNSSFDWEDIVLNND